MSRQTSAYCRVTKLTWVAPVGANPIVGGDVVGADADATDRFQRPPGVVGAVVVGISVDEGGARVVKPSSAGVASRPMCRRSRKLPIRRVARSARTAAGTSDALDHAIGGRKRDVGDQVGRGHLLGIVEACADDSAAVGEDR